MQVAALAVKLPWVFSQDAAVLPLICATALPAFVALTVRCVAALTRLVPSV
jgi:hypothetical protein